MDRCTIPVALVDTARTIVETATRNIGDNGSPVYSALLASQLFEAIKIELGRTPRHEAENVGVLSAALDQCRTASVHVDQPGLMAGQLRAALEMLEAAAPARRPNRGRPRLTVIEGGLSANPR